MIFPLLVAFQAKHLFCDFLFQNSYMLKKVNRLGWELPLLAHAGTHGAFTTTICLLVSPNFWWLGVVDFAVHGFVDRLKGVLQPSKQNRSFWMLFGADQTAHHLTHYAIIWLLVMA